MNRQKNGELKCLRPAGWLYRLLYYLANILLRIFFSLDFKTDPAIKSLPGPVLVLGNHPSYIDPALMAIAVWPHRVHFLTSSAFFHIPLVRPLLEKIRAIPKTQFRSDSAALKNMLRVIRCKGVLGIYPEGQRSLDGSLMPIDSAIGKLIKKLSCNVVLVKEQGAYLSWPRWSKSLMRRGRISVSSSLVFTPEKLASMSTAAIQSELLAALDYNDYEWQRNNRHAYVSLAPASGLHQFCHRCPACGRDLAMLSSGFSFYCSCCGCRWKMDRFGMLRPARRKKAKTVINDVDKSDNKEELAGGEPWLPDPWHWHRWQISAMAQKFRDPEYVLVISSEINQVNPDTSISYIGHGELRLDRGGLHVTTDPGQESSLSMTLPIFNRTGISAEYGRKFEIGLENKGYRFFPDNGQSVAMLADAVYVLHDMAEGKQ